MRGKPWTQEDTAALKDLHAKGWSYEAIAGRIDRKLRTVQNRAHLWGLKPNLGYVYAPWEEIPPLSRAAIAAACGRMAA